MKNTISDLASAPASPFYYIGEDFSSFSPTDLVGDSAASRRECWEAAQEVFSPALVPFADRAGEEFSSARLDRAEKRYFGVPVTAGTWPKRQRFWRFISLQGRGITPRDLRGLYVPAPSPLRFPAPPAGSPVAAAWREVVAAADERRWQNAYALRAWAENEAWRGCSTRLVPSIEGGEAFRHLATLVQEYVDEQWKQGRRKLPPPSSPPPPDFFPIPARPPEYLSWRDEGGPYDPRCLAADWGSKAAEDAQSWAREAQSAPELLEWLESAAQRHYDEARAIAAS